MFSKRLLLLGTAVGLAAGALAAAAPASAAPVPTPYYSVLGDVTGDGLVDRVAFVDLSTPTRSRCYAWVRVGQPGGGLSSPVHVALPLPDGVTEDLCPGEGRVLAAPTPGGRRLAAVVKSVFEITTVRVYDLTGNAVANGRANLESTIPVTGEVYGTVDLDGDGYADWWTTGEVEGSLDTRHGSSWTTLYEAPSSTYAPTMQFFDLNRSGGTDVLVTGQGDGNGFQTGMVDAVDGKTGAVQRLATGTYSPLGDEDGVENFRVGLVDLDHNAFPDISVTPLFHDGSSGAPVLFLNRSQGGRWYFQPLS